LLFLNNYCFNDCLQARQGHEFMTRVLLNHGADVRSVDDDGLTPADVAKTKNIRSSLRQAWTTPASESVIVTKANVVLLERSGDSVRESSSVNQSLEVSH